MSYHIMMTMVMFVTIVILMVMGHSDDCNGGDDVNNDDIHSLYYPGRTVVCFYYFKVAKAWRVPRFRGKCRGY